MIRAWQRGTVLGLVLAAVTLLPVAGLSWLVERMTERRT